MSTTLCRARRCLLLLVALTVYLGGFLALWGALAPQPRFFLPAGQSINDISADGRFLVTSEFDPAEPRLPQHGPVRICHLQNGTTALSLLSDAHRVMIASVSPDSRWLGVREAIIGQPGKLRVFALPEGTERAAHDVPVDGGDIGLVFSPDCRKLAFNTGTWPLVMAGKGVAVPKQPHDQITLWDFAGEKEPRVLDGVRAAFAFSPDGRFFAATVSAELGLSRPASVRLIDLPSGETLASLQPRNTDMNNVRRLTFAPHGATLVAEFAAEDPRRPGFADSGAGAWDVADRRELAWVERICHKINVPIAKAACRAVESCNSSHHETDLWSFGPLPSRRRLPLSLARSGACPKPPGCEDHRASWCSRSD